MCYKVCSKHRMESDMTESTFTFRVDDELKTAFSEAAKANDQTGAQLLRGFMRDFVKRRQNQADYDAWFQREVLQGIADADAGDIVSSEDVERHFASRRAATRRKLAGGQ